MLLRVVKQKEAEIKLFNIDAHISVIHDVQVIFEDLGHTIDSWNLSSHSWVTGEKTRRIGILGKSKWLKIDEKMCKKFYLKYKKKLGEYDGFIHSYPPAFSLLFERFEKPIITIACTRLDFPVFPDNYQWFINGMKRMYNRGLLFPIANNLLDKYYCEKETNFEWQHISSLCDYMQPRYLYNEENKFITWTRSNVKLDHDKVDAEFSISRSYNRDEVHKYKGIIHIPYNLSIMSAFEHYRQNIPIFFPSPTFQEKLWKERGDILSEVLFPNTNLNFNPKLIRLADWYDEDNFYGVIQYESFFDLYDKLNSVDLAKVSEKMRNFNIRREKNIKIKWSRLVEQIR